jgi:hypothetical protein
MLTAKDFTSASALANANPDDIAKLRPGHRVYRFYFEGA